MTTPTPTPAEQPAGMLRRFEEIDEDGDVEIWRETAPQSYRYHPESWIGQFHFVCRGRYCGMRREQFESETRDLPPVPADVEAVQ